MSQTNHVRRIVLGGPHGATLEDWDAMDPAGLVSGEPIQKGCLYDEDEATDYSVGIWDCTAFIDQPGPYPVDEFMLLLDGTVEMLMPDGTRVTVRPGEAFIIPKGLQCQWKMPGTVRKIFMILDGDAPGEADNAGLHRITVPPLNVPITPQPGALATRATHFLNHDSRMSVYTDSFADRLYGPAPRAGRHLVHVQSGSVRFAGNPGESFGPGETFYLLPDSGLIWDIAAGTRLLTASCELAHTSSPT